MASDLLALLDTLDGLMAAMTPGPYCRAHHGTWELQARPNQRLADFGTIDHAADDAEAVQSLLNAYPRLAQALRTALTPTTDGEREAREALAKHDAPCCGRDVITGEDEDRVWAGYCERSPGHDGACDVRGKCAGIDPAHLRTALNLLAIERAKAADAARERAEIVAWLRAGDWPPGPTWQAIKNCIEQSADAIERGAHAKVTP